MDPWQVLGLAPGSDEATIKRAYARRLRDTRPDDDAAAFQQLNEAYQWLLHAGRTARPPVVERPRRGDDAGNHARASTATTDRPVTSADGTSSTVPTAVFEFAPFLQALATQVQQPDPAALRHWLQAHPALYSLDLKWMLTPHVFDALARQAATLNPHRGHLEVLIEFFGVDARLRQRPDIAAALDYLEQAPWRHEPMPAGWENLGQVMDQTGRPGPRRHSASGGGNTLWPIWLALGLMGLLGLVRRAVE